MLYFFLAVTTIYLLVYILELVFGSNIISKVIKMMLFTITFQIYLNVWSAYEDNFVANFSDSRRSQIFLYNHRGPYYRNLLSDEVN